MMAKFELNPISSPSISPFLPTFLSLWQHPFDEKKVFKSIDPT
jgi:hypothetical protein